MAFVEVVDDGPTRTIRLNRPERRNALGQELFDELERAVSAAACWQGQVLVLEGAGPCFSAGADLKDPVLADEPWQSRRVDVDRWNRFVDDVERLPQVTIARLQGATVGGGAVLALACDLRVAEPDLQVSFPELFLGLPLVMGGLSRLVREVGMSRAREVVLTRKTLTAQDCLSWGLVHRVGDTEVLVRSLVAELLQAPAGMQAMTKQALSRLGRTVVAFDGVWSDADVLSLVRMTTEAARRQSP